MISLVAIGTVGILISYSGILAWRFKREQNQADYLKRKQDEDTYLEEQRQRLKTNKEGFMKETKQIVKDRHPESTGHQRRVVASLYKKQIKSS